jgi:hypothetical protein
MYDPDSIYSFFNICAGARGTGILLDLLMRGLVWNARGGRYLKDGDSSGVAGALKDADLTCC